MKREELKELIKETMSEQKNFTAFAKELEVLSKKYGIAVQSIGGVSSGEIKTIRYSSDLSSGDLEYKVTWK